MLTDTQRIMLLQIAREAIGAHLGGKEPVPPSAEPLPQASGIFVTIKRGGELRGCLGVLQLRGSLAEEVAACARDSATADPRFPPMAAAELRDSELEISVLGPLQEIAVVDDHAFAIGLHGLVVEQGARRGLLLPQVAVEWGWTRDQFLQQVCRKAGLPVDAWRSDARVFRFEAQVFREHRSVSDSTD